MALAVEALHPALAEKRGSYWSWRRAFAPEQPLVAEDLGGCCTAHAQRRPQQQTSSNVAVDSVADPADESIRIAEQ